MVHADAAHGQWSTALTMTRSFLAAAAVVALTSCLTAARSDIEHPDSAVTRLAFGSCHKRKYVDPSNTIWDTIQKNKPNAFLWTGDSVYPSSRGIASVEMLQQEYKQLKTNQSLGYVTFKPPLGIYGTWDDHDYGGNDLGMEMPQKQERAEAFLKFLDSPIKLDGRHGIYHSVEWGVAPRKMKAILLDTRWNREPHCIPSVAHRLPLGAAISCITRWLTAGLALPKCSKGSILGKEQFAWLEAQLQKSDAQIHVIVSSVQVLTSSPVIESWGHFPEDQKKLMKLLNGVSGVVLLSGDVHYAEILAPSNKTSTFLEVTSSGLTHDCSVPFYGRLLCKPLLEAFGAHRFRHKDNFFIGKNYGTLGVDWERATFEVLVHDDKGSVVLRTGPMAFEQDRMSDEEIEQIVPVIDGHLLPAFRAILIAMNALILGFLIQRWLWMR